MVKNSIIKFCGVIVIGVVLIIASVLLLGKYGPNANKIALPDGEHSISYNRFTGAVLLFNKNDGTGRFLLVSYCDPEILWSSDSRNFIVGFNPIRTHLLGVSESRLYCWNDDDEDYWIKTVVVPEIGTAVNLREVRFRVTKFVDDNNVLVEFATYVTNPESGKHVSGSYIFDIRNSSARNISVSVNS